VLSEAFVARLFTMQIWFMPVDYKLDYQSQQLFSWCGFFFIYSILLRTP